MLGHFDNLSKFNKYKAVLIFVLIIIALAFSASSPPKVGLNGSNQLKPCTNKQSCINTEYPKDAKNYANPLLFPLDKTNNILKTSKDIILGMNGKIETEKANYIHAVFTSNVFRFKDDFEVRIDDKSKQIQICSNSRIGRYDFDVNRDRFNLFSSKLKEKLL
jgi:uncharacterized protein (DUF1499 family)